MARPAPEAEATADPAPGPVAEPSQIRAAMSKSVYLVKTDESAPALALSRPGTMDGSRLAFDGHRKRDWWPTKPPPEVTAEVIPASPYVFYRFAPGALVVREDAFDCDDFYYLTRDGNEPLPLKCGDVWFEVINIVDTIGPPGEGSAPCAVDQYYSALFRLEGRGAEVFCVSGVSHPANEFKSVYESYGFTGLSFVEVWRGE